MKKIRCSSLPRLDLCPGSMAAEDGIKSEDSAQSLAGTAGHYALEQYYNQTGHVTGDAILTISEFLDGLDDMTASRARWYARIMDDLISSHGGAADIRTELPVEALGLPVGEEKVDFTGHIDLVILCNDGITIVSDYKFNFLEVPDAYVNTQLTGYVTLLITDKRYSGLWSDEIHAVLLAGGNDNPVTATVYGRKERKNALAHVLSIISNSLAEDAMRCPSADACKYCKASGTARCQERLADVSSVPALVNAYEVLPGREECLRLFKAVKMVAQFGEKFMKDLKACVMADPESWDEFFELKNTGSTRTITDAQAAYILLVEEEEIISHDSFMAMLDLPIGKLEKEVKPALKERDIKVKDQKKYIEGLLGSNLVKKEKQPSLKVVVS